MVYDVERGISRFLKTSKEYYLCSDGIVKPEPIREQVVENNPWVFYGKAKGMPCFTRHALYFNAFGIIPEFCVNKCFKTIIKPYTLSDLFKVNDYIKENDKTSKCGLDLRNFSFGSYLGVIYSESIEEARERETEAKKALPDFEIFTKKGCTEFENRLSSKYWNVSDAQIELEEKLRERVDHSWPEHFKLPDWLVEKIQTLWTQMAYAVGDTTWEESPYANKIETSRKPERY
jgi:hypothetical protein